ncbi:membrane-bound transcription factor protease [Capsaspora owczarzaki ATCC 30864]|uniref:Membrane-bound transcription factor site-1 protease n=1 Tax=Capsaspora owczarzaki (strain ATCC 30864) TaxID=595528 RepID=A0A0D2VVN4_CAPO3|nr:membrane-bound transcription factor protease [Capsaspora owczarzaki ATCC 30864]KJE95552.1 membrane-bound transcription factor protease [Capsaspora owczarzaki ATCC 30864]|eukprot:XP_004345585.2 membrane-bound transcription factor protease [Capsaspora owczarzaki ATCC 30864]
MSRRPVARDGTGPPAAASAAGQTQRSEVDSLAKQRQSSRNPPPTQPQPQPQPQPQSQDHLRRRRHGGGGGGGGGRTGSSEHDAPDSLTASSVASAPQHTRTQRGKASKMSSSGTQATQPAQHWQLPWLPFLTIIAATGLLLILVAVVPSSPSSRASDSLSPLSLSHQVMPNSTVEQRTPLDGEQSPKMADSQPDAIQDPNPPRTTPSGTAAPDTSERRRTGRSGSDPAATAVDGAFIVRFKVYSQHDVLVRIVQLALATLENASDVTVPIDRSAEFAFSPSSDLWWSVVHRENPASHLPTDFALLQFRNVATCSFRQAALAALRQHATVRSVSPERRLTRAPLHFIDHEMPTESQIHEGRRHGRLPKELNESYNSSFAAGRHMLAGVPVIPMAAGPHAQHVQVASVLHAEQIWARGFTGNGVRTAVFDTGLAKSHPHFKNIADRTDWTNESTMDDALGHGSFVAGVIASSRECPGLAPDADLYIFRVFTNQQVSYTSWFLDAFNYAIHKKINILNLSIGGPDFLDMPFVEKVWELSANGIIMVSAIGNDGPLYGTLNNPADQSDVIGVGGLDISGHVASFSSRGMTTWELPHGYGRVKPDIVTHGHMVASSHKETGCKTLSGTSVASPVVAGAVTLLSSIIDPASRWNVVNPASMKQALIESANVVPDANIFEQGYGSLNLLGAFNLLAQYTPRASLAPPALDLTECPRMWPFCAQPMYFGAMPVIFNVTILNGMGVSGQVLGSPSWHPTLEAGGNHLDVAFTYSELLWPWSGFLAVHLTARASAVDFTGTAEGTVSLTVVSPPVPPEVATRVTRLTLPIKVNIVPPPPRKMRVMWDQYHNLRYPSGYFPRDNLKRKEDPLDWNGDHIHSNFRDMYMHLRSQGFFIEVLGQPFTCFDARQYGTLLLVDPEEEYFAEEIAKLRTDVVELGLSVIVVADWYNADVMRDKIKFFDENTKRWWTPETGGANVPALNNLLNGFGIALGDKVFAGEVTVRSDGENPFKAPYLSGTSITNFPPKGLISQLRLTDQTDEMLKGLSHVDDNVAVMGLLQTGRSGGRIVVYGDSNCLDSAHSEGFCFWLLDMWLEYTGTGLIDSRLMESLTSFPDGYESPLATNSPQRLETSRLQKYSKVLRRDSLTLQRPIPQCITLSTAARSPLRNATEDFDPHVDVLAGTFGRLAPVGSGPKANRDSVDSPDTGSEWTMPESLQYPILAVVAVTVALGGFALWSRTRHRQQRKLFKV